MATLTHNAHQIAISVERIGPATARELHNEHLRQSQLVARRMREVASRNDFMGTLRESIHVEWPGPQESMVRPGVDYAIYREKGTKPGGKGLPRFEDPAASDIVRWLERRSYAGMRAPRGFKAIVLRQWDLRDRYEGLAWHIRHHGTRAAPFVEPTAVEMAPQVAAALRAAVVRGLKQDAEATS